MRKPDRFERAIEKEYQKWLKGPQMNGWLSIPHILLRRQYAAIRREIRQTRKAIHMRGGDPRLNCYAMAVLDDVLERLDRWRSGPTIKRR